MGGGWEFLRVIRGFFGGSLVFLGGHWGLLGVFWGGFGGFVGFGGILLGFWGRLGYGATVLGGYGVRELQYYGVMGS